MPRTIMEGSPGLLRHPLSPIDREYWVKKYRDTKIELEELKQQMKALEILVNQLIQEKM